MENVKDNANQAPEAQNIESTNEKSKKTVITIGVIVAALIVIALIWLGVNRKGSAKADEAIALADVEMNDSIALKYYMDAAELGHKSGNRAKLHAAIALYQQGKYQEALDYLKDASVSSDVIEAGKFSLMGDCYVNLEKYEDALSCYNKAISASDNNPQIVPFVLVKEANVYRAMQNYNEESNCYNKIINDYPQYAQQLRFDIKKYAERAYDSEK